jgi:short-subunit dehydrogenase involved in D-alanine esterification of teichoic acids
MTSSPRIWLITGANSGLGLSLAQHVLAQGDQVRSRIVILVSVSLSVVNIGHRCCEKTVVYPR